MLIVELDSTAVCASLLPIEYSTLMAPVLSATLHRHLPLRRDHIGTLIVAHDGLHLALTDEKLLQANWTLEVESVCFFRLNFYLFRFMSIQPMSQQSPVALVAGVVSVIDGYPPWALCDDCSPVARRLMGEH